MKVKSKSRWVAIPAEELQAAADAASTTRRKQVKTHSNPKTPSSSLATAGSPSSTRSRNQSQSRDTSLPQQLIPQSSGNMARIAGTTASKSVSRSSTASGPHSRIQSRTGSLHGSPAGLRGVALPPQETEEFRPIDQTVSSSPSLPTPSAPSPLPSVFPVQIQQQQQAKFNAGQNFTSGAVSPHEPPAGSQPAYLSNRSNPNPNPESHHSHSPLPMHTISVEQNIPQPQFPLLPPSHSPSMLSSSSMSYPSPYPFYTAYEYACLPGITHSNPQMYMSGPGLMTPNYGPQAYSSTIQPVEYGLPPSIHSFPMHDTTYFQGSLHNPISVPVSTEAIEPIRPRVVFGSFNVGDRTAISGNTPIYTSRSSFFVGLGSGETISSNPRRAELKRGKKRLNPQRTAGVMMLNSDAEVVDPTEGLNGKGRAETSNKWTFGRFDDGKQANNEEEEDNGQSNTQSQHFSSSHTHLVTPPHPSLPPAYIPVGAVQIPVPVPAPVPPIPLSTLASLPPIHTQFPNPIPPHPSLSHLGPFSAETGPSTSPTLLMNGSGDVRGGRSPEDGGNKHGADNLNGVNNGSEWIVRDFGYGFGREGKTNGVRAKGEFTVDQYFNSRNYAYHGRPRRGSSSYNNPYAGYGDRGGYSPRRGGRGYGRGYRGFRRGGSYGFDMDRENSYVSSSSPREYRSGGHIPPSPRQYQPPFTLSPPPQFQPLPLPPVDHGLHTYIPLPSVYDPSFQTASPSVSDSHSPLNAPMPAPISRIPVALDPTVYYLLGQLEYYLSPQNLAQDFFLRQKMDSHGWIAIPLIASFNRVRQITTDESFVRDVLSMSSVVEIQGDMVRMKEGEWERFVLPGAQTSRVDSIHDFSLTPSSGDSTSKVRSFVEEAVMRHVRSGSDGDVMEGEAGGEIEEESEDEEEEEEEEEEEVVFVMG
ncbi:hypothetical protein F5050DRAFT_311104 [Lentinula boryana]|uniref:HTH La-type RNA-binding domain-containing protein n=1 Tax=Lentinula boryana TaxID=40481 RepID=A0ABQ8QAB5_9AGAR|nr:hypothetical protein F5050DRAFT_311104 [Lentinula boryana]